MNELVGGLLDALTQGGAVTLQQVALLGLPLVALAWLLRAAETALTQRLQRKLGRRAILATAWIGVPIHELSHVIACVLFAHRVERVRLFAPDARTRTLGSVRHTWNPRNPWAQIGRFFIGSAPLLGGSLALWALGATLGDHLVPPLDLAGVSDWKAAFDVAVDNALALAETLTRADSWTAPRTWAFLYLCLCVGAHLAPSGADLDGARAGAFSLVLLWWLVATVVILTGLDLSGAEPVVLALLAPLATVQALALCLSITALALVWLVTAPFADRS